MVGSNGKSSNVLRCRRLTLTNITDCSRYCSGQFRVAKADLDQLGSGSNSVGDETNQDKVDTQFYRRIHVIFDSRSSTTMSSSTDIDTDWCLVCDVRIFDGHAYCSSECRMADVFPPISAQAMAQTQTPLTLPPSLAALAAMYNFPPLPPPLPLSPPPSNFSKASTSSHCDTIVA
jgi:hypothetical protein